MMGYGCAPSRPWPPLVPWHGSGSRILWWAKGKRVKQIDILHVLTLSSRLVTGWGWVCCNVMKFPSVLCLVRIIPCVRLGEVAAMVVCWWYLVVLLLKLVLQAISSCAILRHGDGPRYGHALLLIEPILTLSLPFMRP